MNEPTPTIDFLNNDNLLLFWDYIKMLLTTVSPAVLIWVAVIAVGLLVTIVVQAWRKSADDQIREDEDDYEVRRY